MTAITVKLAVTLKGIIGKRNMVSFWTGAVVPWVFTVKPFIKYMLHVLFFMCYISQFQKV